MLALKRGVVRGSCWMVLVAVVAAVACFGLTVTGTEPERPSVGPAPPSTPPPSTPPSAYAPAGSAPSVGPTVPVPPTLVPPRPSQPAEPSPLPPAASYPSTAPRYANPSPGPAYTPVPTAPALGPYTPPTYVPAAPPAYSYCSPLLPSSPSERPTLVLADVTRLIEAKVADDVIARFIARRSVATELTADDLIMLTQKGASPVVFQALQMLPVARPASPRSDAPEAARYESPPLLR